MWKFFENGFKVDISTKKILKIDQRPGAFACNI